MIYRTIDSTVPGMVHWEKFGGSMTPIRANGLKTKTKDSHE